MPDPKIPRETVKGNVYIRNMLSNIERTFLPIGSIIGKYRIVEEIDRGGMAVVYKAIQLDLDREVALKIMPSNISINRRFMERFMSEARAIARLNHPSIVSIIEVAMDNNIYYLAMEYIKGQNLFYYLNFNKPKLVDVLEIVSRLADALSYAHMQKIIHRDLKLNNVIMRDRLMPVLIDFGLAKALEEEGDDGITRTGEIMGSPAYMAPERLLGGTVDHRSDICSLGIMLYEMLTFKNPYLDQRNLHQTALNVMEANPIPPRKLVPWLPAEIESVTLKAMARDPAARYQSMEEFKDDINRYQRNEPVMARPPSMWSRVHRFLKRRWSVISIAATVIVFSALFAVSLYIQSSKERSHWQLLYSERFSGRLGGGEWSEAPQSDTASWRISNGKLVARSKQRSFLRFARRFNRDILIEFDMGASEKDLYSAGFFLFGETPDSAYCFYIGRQGSGACGLTFPGSRFLFRTADQAKITIGPVNHVVIERIQNAITFQINGVVIARVWDYMPPLGRRHEQLGFFVEGCGVWFDNLKILRRAVPQKPSPTFVADRFWERGDFEAALEEYRSLQVDFGISERVKEIRLCIADCLARLGRYEQAMMTLREAADLQGRDESFESRKLFIEGIILNRLSSVCPSDSVFTVLAQRYPASTVNQSAMAFIIIRIASCIAASLLDSAEREIGLLSGNYDRYGDLWGELSMMVIERYAGRGLYDSAAAVAQRIIRRQERNCEVYTNAKEALGRIFLEKGNKNRAGDLFNQCIAAHLSSESVWEAWMGLASIYEHDFQHKEAATIYHKIYRECPSMFRARWMAALKLGELASRDSARHYASHFEAVVEGAHPFPLPRLIARFYLGEVNESQFKAEWDLHCPDDFMCLYYCARKAKFTREEVVARIYLQDCIDNLPPESWNYILANRAMNNFKKW